jgi:quinol monooxygenase YgiN
MTTPQGTVAVVADVHTKPGCEYYLLDLLDDAVEENRRNEAAILYRLHVDFVDEAHLMFYEIWQDSAAIDAYQESQPFKASLDRAKPATTSVNILPSPHNRRVSARCTFDCHNRPKGKEHDREFSLADKVCGLTT